MKHERQVSIHLDTKPFETALGQFLRVTKSSQALSELIKDFFNSVSQVELIRFEQEITVGASNLVLVVKPSDKFLEFLGAVRASESELLMAHTK